MKRLLFLVFLLPACFTGFGQDDEQPELMKNFAVKWAPAGIFFGKIGLGGEYNFRAKKSLTFNVGIPFEKSITAKIDGKDRDFTTKTFSIMGGYRLYLGKKYMRGFYFEPYIKYVDNEFVANTDFDIDGTERPFIVTSDYSGIGVGGQLGAQFIIAGRVVLDLYILGPEANLSKHNLLAQETGGGLPWSMSEAQDAEQQIRDFIDDIPLLKDNMEVTVNAANRNVRTKYDGFLPGFRIGLSIGIKF